MFQEKICQNTEAAFKINSFEAFPIEIKVQSDQKLDKLLADLSSNSSWYDRKIAAQKIGRMRNPDAMPALLDMLPVDPFWKVRCAIIQALEVIGDPTAIPCLREIQKSDHFQVVRSYAAKAIESLLLV